MRITAPAAALAVALVLTGAPEAGAQMHEMVGIRAQGLGGAFVAVADDATVTWWNPAGLASSPLFSGLLERALVEEPAHPDGQGPAWRGSTSGFAIAYPALGLSYYRLRISEIAPSPSIAEGAPDRQGQGAAGVTLRSLAISHFGATVGQSIGSHLVIGSTLRLLRGGPAVSVEAGDDPLGRAHELDVSTEMKGDLDMGAMASFGPARIGLSVRHLREPTFAEGPDEIVLKRQVRAGVALMGGPYGPVTGLTAAVDADLTTTSTAVGDVRHLAAGAEVWLLQRRVGLRGGISANTVGAVQTSSSGGISVGASGAYLDAALTFGSDKSRSGWGLGLRVTF